MQYQVFIQSPAERRFVASIVGMPAVTVEGTTEAEAIVKVKAALESLLAGGKVVTIEVNPAEQTSRPRREFAYPSSLL